MTPEELDCESYRRSVSGTDNIFYKTVDEKVEIIADIGRQDIEKWLDIA